MSKKVITILVVAFLIITILVCIIMQTNIVLKNNITVIARSIGERTQEQSIDELKRVIGNDIETWRRVVEERKNGYSTKDR